MSRIRVRPSRTISSHSARFMDTFGAPLPQTRKTLKFKALAADVPLDDSDDLPDRCVCLGPTIGDIELDIHSHNHSIANWKRGIMKRCAHAQNADINDPIFKEFYDFVDNYIRHLGYVPPDLNYQDMQNEWLDHSRYNQRQRQQMRDRAQQVINGEINIRKILTINSFIKSEFYNELKECRIINSRSDWFKAFIGPYIKQVEKIIYDEHFIKHKTPREVAQIMEYVAEGYDLFYETDYSSFEGSFTLDFMKRVELKMFKHVLMHYPEAVSMIEKSYNVNNVHYRGDPRYACEFEGSRMSGEMWTSLCNGFTNMLLVLFMLKKSDSMGKFLVEGDDGFIACTRELDFNIAKRLGFSLKIEATLDHTHVKFCSLSTCEGRIVPDIRRVLSHYGVINDIQRTKLFVSNSHRGQRQLRQLMKSKAHSLLATSAGIPILQELALQQLRCYEHDILNPKYFDYWESEFYDLYKTQQAVPITSTMRRFVEENFDISVRDQLEIERAIRKCTAPNYDIIL